MSKRLVFLSGRRDHSAAHLVNGVARHRPPERFGDVVAHIRPGPRVALLDEREVRVLVADGRVRSKGTGSARVVRVLVDGEDDERWIATARLRTVRT